MVMASWLHTWRPYGFGDIRIRHKAVVHSLPTANAAAVLDLRSQLHAEVAQLHPGVLELGPEGRNHCNGHDLQHQTPQQVQQHLHVKRVNGHHPPPSGTVSGLHLLSVPSDLQHDVLEASQSMYSGSVQSVQRHQHLMQDTSGTSSSDQDVYDSDRPADSASCSMEASTSAAGLDNLQPGLQRRLDSWKRRKRRQPEHVNYYDAPPSSAGESPGHPGHMPFNGIPVTPVLHHMQTSTSGIKALSVGLSPDDALPCSPPLQVLDHDEGEHDPILLVDPARGHDHTLPADNTHHGSAAISSSAVVNVMGSNSPVVDTAASSSSKPVVQQQRQHGQQQYQQHRQQQQQPKQRQQSERSIRQARIQGQRRQQQQQLAEQVAADLRLTQAIMSSTKPQQLAELLADHEADMNHIHVSALLGQLARLCVPSSSQHHHSHHHQQHQQQEQEQAQEQHPQPDLPAPSTSPGPPATLSSSEWVGVMQMVLQLAPLAKRKMRHMQLYEVSVVMSSLVKLRAPVGKPFFITCMVQAAKRFKDCTAQGLSELLWSVAQSGMQGLRADWAALFYAAVEQRWAEFTPQGLTIMLHAFATMGFMPPQAWMQQLLNQLEQKLGQCQPTDVALALWATAKLHSNLPSALLDTLCNHSLPLLPLFSAQELCISLWGLARERHRPPAAWMDAFYQGCSQQLPAMTGQGLAVIMHSLARLQLQPPEAWMHQCLQHAAATEFDSFNSQGMAIMVHGMATMGYHPGDAWLSTFCMHTEMMQEEFKPVAVKKIQEAFRLLGYKPASRVGRPNSWAGASRGVGNSSSSTDSNGGDSNGRAQQYVGHAPGQTSSSSSRVAGLEAEEVEALGSLGVVPGNGSHTAAPEGTVSQGSSLDVHELILAGAIVRPPRFVG